MKYLIVIDMQNDFLDGPLGNEMCRVAIPEVVNLIKSEKWNRIFLTRDTHFDNYTRTLEGRKLPIPHCKFQSEGWKVNSEIMDALHSQDVFNYGFVDKPTFGSLSLIKSIENYIEENFNTCDDEAKELIRRVGCGEGLEFHVCGVCTSICVLANVVILRAKYPDAKIIIHERACGDVTKEMHNAALVCFKSQQCEVE